MTETFDPRHVQAPDRRRVDPPLRAAEADSLMAFLDYHRDTLRTKVAGLDRAQLDRTLAPSPMTLGGLVSHLTLVEVNWFSVVLFGNAPAPPWDAIDWKSDNDRDWHLAAGRTLEELLAPYEETVARSDLNIAAALARDGLDTVSVKSSRRTDPGNPFSLRWILLHMIEEYARHNGHADLLRESIDGQVGQ